MVCVEADCHVKCIVADQSIEASQCKLTSPGQPVKAVLNVVDFPANAPISGSPKPHGGSVSDDASIHGDAYKTGGGGRAACSCTAP